MISLLRIKAKAVLSQAQSPSKNECLTPFFIMGIIKQCVLSGFSGKVETLIKLGIKPYAWTHPKRT